MFRFTAEAGVLIGPSEPGSDSLHANVTSLLTIYDGAAATFSNYNGSVELPYSGDDAWWYFDHGLLYDYKFGGEKASKNDPPNSECESAYDLSISQSLDKPIVNDTVLYLPWSAFSDNSTRHSGNIAFVLISSRDNASGSDLEDPINQTVDLTVWSWIADSALSKLRMIHCGLWVRNVVQMLGKTELLFRRMCL